MVFALAVPLKIFPNYKFPSQERLLGVFEFEETMFAIYEPGHEG